MLSLGFLTGVSPILLHLNTAEHRGWVVVSLLSTIFCFIWMPLSIARRDFVFTDFRIPSCTSTERLFTTPTRTLWFQFENYGFMLCCFHLAMCTINTTRTMTTPRSFSFVSVPTDKKRWRSWLHIIWLRGLSFVMSDNMLRGVGVSSMTR